MSRVILGTLIIQLVSLHSLAALQGQEPVGRQREVAETPVEQVDLARAVFTELRAQTGDVTVMVDANGTFEHMWTQNANTMFDGQLPFLECEETRRELDLVGEQQSKYEQIVEGWRQKHDQAYKDLEAGLVAEVPRSEIKKIIEGFKSRQVEMLENVDNVLLSHQSDALSQIQIRYLLRTNGLIAVLDNKHVKEFAGLSQKDVGSVRSRIRRRSRELAKWASEARDQAVETVLEPLDQEQQRKLKALWPYLGDPANPHCEQLRIHLEFHSEFESLSKADSVFTKIRRFPSYLLTVSGTFVPQENEREVDPLYADHDICHAFNSMFKKDDFVDRLGVSDHQMLALEAVLDAFRASDSKASSISLSWEGGTNEELEAMKSRVRSIRQSAAADAVAEMRRVLSRPQWNQFEDLGWEALDRMYGPIFSLTEGKLGDDLAISKSQKRAIREAAEEARKEFEKATLDIEEKWLTQLLEVLSDKQKERIEQLIGPRLMSTPANLGVYLPGTF